MDRNATPKLPVHSLSEDSDCVGAWGAWGTPLINDRVSIRPGICFLIQGMEIFAILTCHCIRMGMNWAFTSTIQPFG